jgi:hypothetical protein
MRLAIMQPYFFPYIGYYQLMHAVDKFVILDDVYYIKGGWVNRNIIPICEKAHWVTIPLQTPSQNRLINETLIAGDNGWKRKMIAMVDKNYSKGSNSKKGKTIFQETIKHAGGNLAEFLTDSLKKVCSFLQLKHEIILASEILRKENLVGEDRIIGICKTLKASSYINLPGGRKLYHENAFADSNIELRFLNPSIHAIKLKSGLNNSIYVSILDLIMNNDLDQIQDSLSQYSLSN